MRSPTERIDRLGKKDIVTRNPSTVAHALHRLREHAQAIDLRVLSGSDWMHWQSNGYVVVRHAVDPSLADAIAQLMWEFEELDPADPAGWYTAARTQRKREEASFNAGMIELYHHQLLWNARQTRRVYDAFVDIWGREDLWVSIDRCNFNLPTEPGVPFKSAMHWDYDPQVDVHNVQGVLAISDQGDDVGGFSCIPQLYRDFDSWRRRQPADWDWYRPDVAGFTPTNVPLNKGDLLIFNSRLCHAIRENRSPNRVRMAQYIAMMPAQEEDSAMRAWRIQSWHDRIAPRGYSFHGDPRQRERNRYSRAELSPLGKKLLGLQAWDE